MNDDKNKPYVMGDDERATIGQRGRSSRESTPPKKPSKLEEILSRIPTTWKALTLVAAIFFAGVMGHEYVVEYTKKYATKEDLAAHTQREAALLEQIRSLREADAARAADISAIKSDTAAVREDIRTLLQFMLNNPPARSASPPRNAPIQPTRKP